MKHNFFCLPQPKQQVVCVCLKDDCDSSIEVELNLHALSVVEEYFALDRSEELIERYITGTDCRPAVPFPAIDGNIVRISQEICRIAATLEVMQTGEERYDAEQLIAMAFTKPNLWRRLLYESEQLLKDINFGYDLPKKGCTAVLRTAIWSGHWHPDIIYRWDRLLCSINDRLGGKSGEHIDFMGFSWLSDIMDFYKNHGELYEEKS